MDDTQVSGKILDDGQSHFLRVNMKVKQELGVVGNASNSSI